MAQLGKARRWTAFGPAIIVGSVVLGPGTIFSSTRVGCEFGYQLAWVVVAAAVLMIGMTALAARLGTELDETPCAELARRLGRAPAALVGIVLFLVIACFQFSNNIGIVAALRPLLGDSRALSIAVLIALNLLAGLAVFGLRRLYRPIEVLMKLLVLAMLVGFVGNLFLARPSVAATAGGLVPRLPAGTTLSVLALVATTFSVSAAFFTAYLVRAKGWKRGDAERGLWDSILGISVLGALTLVILTTAAAVLHGRVAPGELESVADVARVFEPMFGPASQALFCVGLLAGSFSSFLVNVMIGGTVLSDGLGLGGDLDGRWPRAFTAAALGVGMLVALMIEAAGFSSVRPILIAQALTVTEMIRLRRLRFCCGHAPGPESGFIGRTVEPGWRGGEDLVPVRRNADGMLELRR